MKVPLKTWTNWSHIKTVDKAVKRVAEWPEWKRTSVLFRDRYPICGTPKNLG